MLALNINTACIKTLGKDGLVLTSEKCKNSNVNSTDEDMIKNIQGR